MIDEEKKFGVDHYDDDINETGNSHCLQAYMEYRANTKPIICPYFSNFGGSYELFKKLRCAGEIFEIRQCKDLHT